MAIHIGHIGYVVYDLFNVCNNKTALILHQTRTEQAQFAIHASNTPVKHGQGQNHQTSYDLVDPKYSYYHEKFGRFDLTLTASM